MVNAELINEFVELTLLNERIRGKGFNFSRFKQLNLEEMYFYARDHLTSLGVGSARTVWVLSSSKALKIARFTDVERGRAQNEEEFTISKNSETKQIIARVIDNDHEFSWLISELVRPILMQEFHRAIGMKFDDAMYLISRLSNEKLAIDDRASLLGEFHASTKAKAFIQSIIEFVKQSSLVLDDITTIDHWGKTTDGRIVILDYGYTINVAQKHY